MLFFSSNRKSISKNFSQCYGCGLCTLVCPVWQQTRDVSHTPHGHAKAMQFGGDINVNGLFACVLCGACEPVCPENISIIEQLVDLRLKNSNQSRQGFFHNKNTRENVKPGNHKVLLFADNALLDHKLNSGERLLDQVLELLNKANKNLVGRAQDNGDDISQALQSGFKIPVNRKEEFIGSVNGASKLIVADGLLKNMLQQWLPGVEIRSLGYELSSLSSIQNNLGPNDLYIIESQAYNADFNSMVKHYDAIKHKCGCAFNLDLQRLAMPTGGICSGSSQAIDNRFEQDEVCLDSSLQGKWILQGLSVERIVVENITDGIIMKNIFDKPVIHVSELAGNV